MSFDGAQCIRIFPAMHSRHGRHSRLRRCCSSMPISLRVRRSMSMVSPTSTAVLSAQRVHVWLLLIAHRRASGVNMRMHLVRRARVGIDRITVPCRFAELRGTRSTVARLMRRFNRPWCIVFWTQRRIMLGRPSIAGVRRMPSFVRSQKRWGPQ